MRDTGFIGEVRRGLELGYSRNNKYIWIACVDCLKERWVRLLGGKPESVRCSSCCQIYNGGHYNPLHKNGRTVDGRGYILLRLRPSDFFYSMAFKNGYVPEHRLVVAQLKGRCLLPWEVVHHKNGIKDDNRPQNLELLPSGKYHVVDRVIKGRLRLLENKITKLSQNIRLLQWHIKELEEKADNIINIEDGGEPSSSK